MRLCMCYLSSQKCLSNLLHPGVELRGAALTEQGKALVLILHTVKDINVNRIWSFIQSQIYRCNKESSEIMPKECTWIFKKYPRNYII